MTASQDNKWPLNDWGVLGLAPNGSFFNYLHAVYDESEEVSIAVKFNLDNKKATNDDLKYETQIYLNPTDESHYEAKDKVGDFYINTQESNYWYLQGSVELEGTEFKYSNENMCLDTYTNELIGIVEGEVWCNRVRSLVCKKLEKGNCKSFEADLNKAPEIKLILLDQTIAFTHEDYIYFDKGGLQCRFGDPTSARYQGTCGKNTEVVLGKLFLSKYTPTFRSNKKNNTTTLTLTKEFKAPKSRKLIWLILGIIAIVLAAAGLVFVCYSKFRKGKPEGEYTAV